MNYTPCKPSVCLFDKSQLSGTLSLSVNVIYGADCISAKELCVLVKQRKTQGTSDVIRVLVRFTDFALRPLNLVLCFLARIWGFRWHWLSWSPTR